MRIRTKTITLLACFVGLPILILIYLSFFYFQLQMRDLIFGGLKTTGYVQYQRVLETVARYKTILISYGSRTMAKEYLVKYYDGKEKMENLKQLEDHLGFAITSFEAAGEADLYNEVINIGLIDNDNNILVSHSKDGFFPKCIGAAELYGDTETNHFSILKNQNNYYIEACRSLILKGRRLGILVVTLDPKSLRAITGDYSIFGKTGETLMAFKNNNNEAEFFIGRRLESALSTRHTVALTEKDVPITHALSGENVFLEHAIDYRGIPVIASTFFIPEVNWGLVAKIDTAEALAPIQTLSIVSIILLIILLAAGILLIYFINITIVNPIKKLSRLSVEVAKGNFAVSLPIKLSSAKNEIGQLANNFFEMVARLRELYSNLDKKVAEKTRDLKESNNALEEQKMAIFNILEDTEKEKEKIDVLAKDLQKFKLAVDNASDQIIITDLDGTVLYTNEAAYQTTGYPVQEIIGKKAGKLWGGLMPKEFYVRMWDTIKNKKKDFEGEVINRRKNGEKYEASIDVAPILDEKGKVMFFVGLERDITKAKAIDRAKTEFVSLASHQLRTPLTAIKWYVETLKEEGGSWTRHEREYLDEVYKGNERMIELVNALLNVSRIEMGAFVINPEPADIVKIMKTTIREQSEAIKNKKIKLMEKYDSLMGKLFLDVALTHIICQNLLSNAVRYTKDGGHIDLRVAHGKKNILITVEDNGIGIPQAQQDKIFQKLFRADNAREMDTSGTGLGLYIVKAIVTAAGGKIWFESEEGKGSTFFVSLPLRGMKKIKGEKSLA